MVDHLRLVDYVYISFINVYCVCLKTTNICVSVPPVIFKEFLCTSISKDGVCEQYEVVWFSAE